MSAIVSLSRRHSPNRRRILITLYQRVTMSSHLLPCPKWIKRCGSNSTNRSPVGGRTQRIRLRQRLSSTPTNNEKHRLSSDICSHHPYGPAGIGALLLLRRTAHSTLHPRPPSAAVTAPMPFSLSTRQIMCNTQHRLERNSPRLITLYNKFTFYSMNYQ